MNSTESIGSPLPNVNERLAQLRPSKELLEYYRRKIAEFDNEHQQMVAKLEAYRCTYEEQVCWAFCLCHCNAGMAGMKVEYKELFNILFAVVIQVLRLKILNVQ